MDELDETAPLSAEIATIEEWAKRKDMENRFKRPWGGFVEGNPLFQDFAQARAFAGWVDRQQVTEAEFDAAVVAAKSHTFR